jgi:hypothetical protein
MSDATDQVGPPTGILGMSEETMLAYIEELLREQAEQTAAEKGTTPDAELSSPGFAAVRATMSYAVRLVAANNAYLTRHLLDLGVIGRNASEAE